MYDILSMPPGITKKLIYKLLNSGPKISFAISSPSGDLEKILRSQDLHDGDFIDLDSLSMTP